MNVDRLERLVTEWRARAKNLYSRPAEQAHLDCAEELSAVLSSQPVPSGEASTGPRTLNTEEAGKALGVSAKSVARWARESDDPDKDENKLPNAFKTSDNGVWKIPRADVRRLTHGNGGEETEDEEDGVKNIESLLDR